MSKSNGTEIEEEKEIGSYVQLFVWRLPKKNHDTMVQFNNQWTDIFKKHRMRSEFFQLSNTDHPDMEGFTSIAKTVSANQDEEVWLELEYYRDRKHRDDVCAKMENDESALSGMKQFMDLIVPGSSCITGEFSRLRV